MQSSWENFGLQLIDFNVSHLKVLLVFQKALTSFETRFASPRVILSRLLRKSRLLVNFSIVKYKVVYFLVRVCFANQRNNQEQAKLLNPPEEKL